MPVFPEREPKRIVETPEEVSPLVVERKEVVQPIPVTFNKQVKSDNGKPLIQTTSTMPANITLPKSSVELTQLSKGSVSDSITWFAAFWLRMIKKAIHFGWQILGGK